MSTTLNKTEKDWNSDALSREFESSARNAERYLEELRLKVRRNRSYEAIYDQTCAEFYVYNYLHGRTFLESRELLLAELKNFLKYDIKKPSEVFDFERFLFRRKSLIESLSERFQNKK
jgi:hypothetical protein